MKLNKDRQRLDQYIYRCRLCKSKKSIRFGTFFEQFPKIPLQVLVRIIFHYYLEGYNASKTTDEIIKNAGFYISYGEMKLIFSAIRVSVSKFVQMEYQELTFSEVTEIDESLFSHWPLSYDHNNQNRANRQIWAFGIYHRQSKQIVVQIVNDRTRETLEAIIQRYCRQGSEIHSDGWASYAHLDELGYVHREIIKYGTNRNRNRRGRDFRRIRGRGRGVEELQIILQEISQ